MAGEWSLAFACVLVGCEAGLSAKARSPSSAVRTPGALGASYLAVGVANGALRTCRSVQQT